MIRIDQPDEVELEWWPDAVAVLKITTSTGNFSAYALCQEEVDQLRQDLAGYDGTNDTNEGDPNAIDIS